MSGGLKTGADKPRERIEVDVVCVGAGVASLAAAYRLLDRSRQAGRPVPRILVLEKGRRVGAHVLSGAVVDKDVFGLLLGERAGALPVAARVEREAVYALTARRGFCLPWVPPPMRARGLVLASLGDVSAWLAEQCASAGADVVPEATVASLVEEDGRVAGVLLADRGRDREGRPRASFEPGAEVRARAVVLGEGARGLLAARLVRDRGLDAGANEQTYALGVKELVELPSHPHLQGTVVHTFGYPLDSRTYGGGFFYGLSSTLAAVGLVVGLDYRNAALNLHDCFRAFKAHPEIRRRLQGGRVVGYGAKMLPEGGFFAVPRLVAGGALLVGDAAGLLDSVRLKGVDLAVASGMAAGDTLFDCLRDGDWTAAGLGRYEERLQTMEGWLRLRRVRNVRAAFEHGLLPGMLATGLSWATRGMWPPGRSRKKPDRAALLPLNASGTELSPKVACDLPPALCLSLADDLYLSGTQHEEDQPAHVRALDPALCAACRQTYAAPCTRFCPAEVYTWDDPSSRLLIQPANCLHCRTCLVKCPHDNIEWICPESGGGPRYRGM